MVTKLKLKVFRSLSDIYCKVFEKKFQAIIIFAGHFFLDHFRCFAGF